MSYNYCTVHDAVSCSRMGRDVEIRWPYVIYSGCRTSVLIQQVILQDINTVSCFRLRRDVKKRWPYIIFNGCPTSVLIQQDIFQDINTVSCSPPRWKSSQKSNEKIT